MYECAWVCMTVSYPMLNPLNCTNTGRSLALIYDAGKCKLVVPFPQKNTFDEERVFTLVPGKLRLDCSCCKMQSHMFAYFFRAIIQE